MSQNFVSKFALDNAISNAKLRDSGALSVIGRSANSTGDPDDIVALIADAGPDATTQLGQILRVESGPLLKFGGHSKLGVGKAKYHPDREPTSGLDTSCSENFAGNVEHATWRWANQGTSSIRYEMDTLFLIPQYVASESDRVRWVTAPGAVDFCFTVKMTRVYAGTAATSLYGICALTAGTEASPTSFQRLSFTQNAPSSAHSTMTNYTGGGAADATAALGDSNASFGNPWAPVYMQFRYVASTKALTSYYSFDGMTWQFYFTKTVAADPISLGFLFDPRSSTAGNGHLRVHWVRTFTSGVNGATANQYANGQIGE